MSSPYNGRDTQETGDCKECNKHQDWGQNIKVVLHQPKEFEDMGQITAGFQAKKDTALLG